MTIGQCQGNWAWRFCVESIEPAEKYPTHNTYHFAVHVLSLLLWVDGATSFLQ